QSFRIVDNGERAVDVSRINLDQRTQAALLKDDALFGQVLQNGNSELRKTAWFQSLKTGTEAKDDLRSDFKAEVIPESRLVAVKFSSGDKKSPKVVVEEIVGQHLENQKKINENKQLERSVMLNNL